MGLFSILGNSNSQEIKYQIVNFICVVFATFSISYEELEILLSIIFLILSIIAITINIIIKIIKQWKS